MQLKNWEKQILKFLRYRYEMALEQNKDMVEEHVEGAEGLEDVDTIHSSDADTEQ